MPWLAFGMMTRELRDGEIIVGAASDAGWRVTTGDLMPRHFSLVTRGREVTVRACSTDHVVAVNGRQLSGDPQPLRDGTILSQGRREGRAGGQQSVPRQRLQSAGSVRVRCERRLR